MADVTLKVSTDALAKKSVTIKEIIRNLENDWNLIDRVVQGSVSFWDGDASTRHRKILKDNRPDVEEILKRLREHPQELEEMAGVYQEKEKEVLDLAASLPDDAIV